MAIAGSGVGPIGRAWKTPGPLKPPQTTGNPLGDTVIPWDRSAAWTEARKRGSQGIQEFTWENDRRARATRAQADEDRMNAASRAAASVPLYPGAGQPSANSGRRQAQKLRTETQAADRQSMESLIGQYAPEPAMVSRPVVGADEGAARASAFARAKEQAAMTARASMTALDDVVAERGLMGSSVEAGEAGRVIGGARADIHDFTRGQLESDLERSRQVADQNYTGQIQQRGQNLSRQQSILALLSRLY